jgi:hypothetical protein
MGSRSLTWENRRRAIGCLGLGNLDRCVSSHKKGQVG